MSVKEDVKFKLTYITKHPRNQKHYQRPNL